MGIFWSHDQGRQSPVASFGILTLVKSGFFLCFSKMLSRSHDSVYGSPVPQYWIFFLLSCPRLMTRVVGLES